MARTETEKGMDNFKRESSLVFTEITPPHGWKQDSHFHYLRLTLPGFEAKDITIHMDKYGHLVVRGNKQVTEHKYISFEETFDVPNDAKLDDARGLFEDDGQIYNVAIPKVKEQQHAIAMPHKEHHDKNPNPKAKAVGEKDGGSIHQNMNTNKVSDEQVVRQGSSRDYLKHIRGERCSKNLKFAFLIAVLIAFLIIMVALIVKLRRR